MLFIYLALILVAATVLVYLAPTVRAFAKNETRDGHLDLRFKTVSGLRWILLTFIWLAPATIWNAPLYSHNFIGYRINWETVIGVYCIILAATLLGTRWMPMRRKIFQPRFSLFAVLCVGTTAATIGFCYLLQTQLQQQRLELYHVYSLVGIDRNQQDRPSVKFEHNPVAEDSTISLFSLQRSTFVGVIYGVDNKPIKTQKFQGVGFTQFSFENRALHLANYPFALSSLIVPVSLYTKTQALDFQELTPQLNYPNVEASDDSSLPGEPLFVISGRETGNRLARPMQVPLGFYRKQTGKMFWHIVVYKSRESN